MAMTVLICTLLVAFFAWFAIPRVMGWTPMVVLSGSMEPTLPLGSVAMVEPRAATSIVAGDLLTFHHPERPGTLVTHRVTEATRLDNGLVSFKTKGDANNVEDKWAIMSPQVVGTVKFDVPYAGYAADKVRSPLGFLMVIAVPAIVLGVGEVRGIVRQVRTARRRRSPEPGLSA